MSNILKNTGFTLIELLLCLSLIAIISALALPSFHASRHQSYRSAAKVALLDLQARQVEHLSENNRYAVSLDALGYNAARYIDQQGNDVAPSLSIYQIQLAPSDDDASYSASATAMNSQRNDVDCLQLTINEHGERLPANCW